jgi:hypothetical protein
VPPKVNVLGHANPFGVIVDVTILPILPLPNTNILAPKVIAPETVILNDIVIVLVYAANVIDVQVLLTVLTVQLDELASKITGSAVVETGKVPVFIALIDETVDQLVAKLQSVVPVLSLL